MRTIYELNEKDIVTIVAERFDIGTEHVTVSYENKTSGYGVNESNKPAIKVEIETDQDVDDVV